MDLDCTSKDTAKDAWFQVFDDFFSYHESGIAQVHFKFIKHSVARAVATEAWSQVVDSIISDNPPSDMSQEYYHSRPESGSDYLQEQLKHLEIYRYKLGIKNIHVRMMTGLYFRFVVARKYGDEIGLLFDSEDSAESDTYSEVVQKYEHDDEVRLWLETLGDVTKSNTYPEVEQADKGEDLQVIENIQGPMRSSVHHGVLQTNEGEYQQGIENIQCVQADKGEDLQVIENIQCPMRSVMRFGVVQTNEGEYQQGIENIQWVQADRGDELQVIENIQCPVRSAVRSGVVQTNEGEYQQGIENIQYPIFVRSTVRMDAVQTNKVEDQQGIEDIQYPVRTVARTDVMQTNKVEDHKRIENFHFPVRSAVHSIVVQADKDQQGMEIQCPIRSGVRSEVVQANEDEDQRGIEKIQSPVRTAVHAEDIYQQRIIEHLMIYGVHYKGAQANKGENEATTITLEEIQAKGLLVLYELLELVKNGDRGKAQQSTPRSEVQELINHLHDDGIDSTQNDLVHLHSYLNYGYIEKDTPLQYIKNYIELILEIFGMESCQRTLCRMRGEVEVIRCKYCQLMQENEEISTLFDELLELVENGDHVHEGEKPNLRFKVLKLIKVLHHYGVDTIQSAVKEALEGLNQEYVIVEKDSIIGYKKKALEVMLRICDIQTCQKTLSELISTTESDQVLYT